MADNEQSKRTAQAKQYEALFVFGVIGIVDQPGTLVERHGSRLFKGDAMLVRISTALRWSHSQRSQHICK